MTRVEPFGIGLVGAGPRGLIALQRLCSGLAASASDRPVHLHVIDPYEPGAGRVWRGDQSRSLLMNSPCARVTVFGEPPLPGERAARPTAGPTLWDWARAVADGSVPADPQAAAEARSLTPAACTTRAFHGSYLRWAFDHVRRSAPARVQIFDHRATARALDDAPNGCQAVRIAAADGRELTLTVDAVVLAQGHVDMLPDAGEDWFAGWARARGLVHVPASNPADVNLDGIAAGEPVLIRGLGLNFFDYVAMLTTGRGGRYERAANGRLRYLASGREPVLFAGSGRGVPQPSLPASEPPSAPGVDLAARLRESAGSGPIDFRRHIWPLALHEIGRLRNAPAAPVPVDDTSASQRDVDALVRPASGLTFRSPGEYREWAARLMRTDLRPEGARPEAVGRALSSVRRQVRDLAREGRISGRSFRDHVLGTFASLDNVGAEGPQSARLEELSALMDSAAVCLVGPHMLIEADEDAGRFAAYSPAVSGSRVVARCLIEAHLPAPDIRRTSDPLLRHLAATGQIRQRSLPDGRGDYATGALDVDTATVAVVRADGTPHPRRFGYGPPTELVPWVTSLDVSGIVGEAFRDADRIAAGCLRLMDTADRSLDPVACSARYSVPHSP
ncbi:FAD/NAD(P)-binding protein [Streptomyces sp. NBC_00669]|uniref:FAD/NAD(P)-binding protein n=1 Tax=Streptomyces sp. NBC_00669 TaxID=2976011 RepID=UPI002E312C91|nr:FAD/NAD(P)-binding protein [Streptomyces sp. NBC_00669]